MVGYEPKPDPCLEAASRGTAKVLLLICAFGLLPFLLFAALARATPTPAEPLLVLATWFIGFAVVIHGVLDRFGRSHVLRKVIERRPVAWAVTLVVSLLATLAVLWALHELRATSGLLAILPLCALGSILGWGAARRFLPSETARLDRLQRMRRGRGW
jgi:hypothetical protein